MIDAYKLKNDRCTHAHIRTVFDRLPLPRSPSHLHRRLVEAMGWRTMPDSGAKANKAKRVIKQPRACTGNIMHDFYEQAAESGTSKMPETAISLGRLRT